MTLAQAVIRAGARRAIFRALSERVDFRRGQIDDRLYRRVHGFHGELHAHAHRDRSPSPCRHPQKRARGKNHNRRHDIDLEVALASRLNHTRSRIAERLHEVVLALQRLAHLTRINALACSLAAGHELVSRRVGIRMLFHHSSHSTKSPTALPAGALIP